MPTPQVEGTLKLEEVAEAGTSTHTLFSSKSMLWVKDRLQKAACPNSLRFSFPLPTAYVDGDKTYVRIRADLRVAQPLTCRASLCHRVLKPTFPGSLDSGQTSPTTSVSSWLSLTMFPIWLNPPCFAKTTCTWAGYPLSDDSTFCTGLSRRHSCISLVLAHLYPSLLLLWRPV